MPASLVARISVLILILAFAAPVPAASQPSPQPGLVSGVVVDSSGASIPGATVVLRVGAVERETVTDLAGRFAFDGVPPGRAVVSVMIEKFAPVSIDVSAGRPALRVVLQPETVSETVTVIGSQLIVPRVTSATKTDTPLRDVPQSISIVTKELIAEQRMQSMADVVRYMPGVGMAQGEGNRDTPILRGNASTSDFFVDGIRDDVQYFRDLYNVERVEALKGPNAMMFGRGGVGGVINRVSRQAEWRPSREVNLQVGSWNNRRLTADLGRGFNEKIAARFTAVYENSDSYRAGVGLERYGVNPTVAFALGVNTTLRAGYEYFHDKRTADRGISSFNGRPVVTDPSTFFGNPDESHSDATIHVFSSVLEHKFGNGITLRNRISYGDYDKFYQNVFPGAVNASGTSVSLSAYNNATQRGNLFNQTDVIVSRRTGRIDHTVLAGAELGRQLTDNFRTTGFFTTLGPAVTTVSVPLASPVTSLPLAFRQNATDADNHGVAAVAAVYAQDQVSFGEHVQAVVGLRFESFNMDFRNNRTATDFSSSDELVSPRAGLIYKPTQPVSIYGSYSLSYLPRAGEQLGSLSLSNQALDPEEFRNYEVGAKWDLAPSLAFTAALYRLDRGNVVVPDPIDPTVSILVDAQQTKGLELGLGGRLTSAWSLIGGYAYQDGEITRSISATAQAGASLAQLPKHSFSLWNKYDLSSQWSVGLGLIHRGEIFTSTDNTVILPSFFRVDAGVFFNLNSTFQAQLNVENLFDEDYYSSAHSNTNITPGSPRAFRVALNTRF
jgi:catecholate siderophore receptor